MRRDEIEIERDVQRGKARVGGDASTRIERARRCTTARETSREAW